MVGLVLFLGLNFLLKAKAKGEIQKGTDYALVFLLILIITLFFGLLSECLYCETCSLCD